MGRPPCCDKSNVKRGPWTAEEDAKMLAYVAAHGAGNWTLVPKKAGLNRCGKSCRLRWTNYLRPDLNHTGFTPHEEDLILRLHRVVGSRWSLIARHLPGRTDNDVKNYWNTKLRKKLTQMGIDPITHKPLSQLFTTLGTIVGISSAPVGSGAFSPPLPPLSPILTEFERGSSHDEHSTVQCYDFKDGSGEMWRNYTDEDKEYMKTDNRSSSSVQMGEDVSMDSSVSFNILDWVDDQFHGLLAHDLLL